MYRRQWEGICNGGVNNWAWGNKRAVRKGETGNARERAQERDGRNVRTGERLLKNRWRVRNERDIGMKGGRVEAWHGVWNREKGTRNWHTRYWRTCERLCQNLLLMCQNMLCVNPGFFVGIDGATAYPVGTEYPTKTIGIACKCLVIQQLHHTTMRQPTAAGLSCQHSALRALIRCPRCRGSNHGFWGKPLSSKGLTACTAPVRGVCFHLQQLHDATAPAEVHHSWPTYSAVSHYSTSPPPSHFTSSPPKLLQIPSFHFVTLFRCNPLCRFIFQPFRSLQFLLHKPTKRQKTIPNYTSNLYFSTPSPEQPFMSAFYLIAQGMFFTQQPIASQPPSLYALSL